MHHLAVPLTYARVWYVLGLLCSQVYRKVPVIVLPVRDDPSSIINFSTKELIIEIFHRKQEKNLTSTMVPSQCPGTDRYLYQNKAEELKYLFGEKTIPSTLLILQVPIWYSLLYSSRHLSYYKFLPAILEEA